MYSMLLSSYVSIRVNFSGIQKSYIIPLKNMTYTELDRKHGPSLHARLEYDCGHVPGEWGWKLPANLSNSGF